ncbi:segregation and condensation protein A [Acaricomes phytoseiuli]|uniref:segregation and condensation protein A n=1 Tax=Acaricomes phytoseiuli TaxID=291968 RepID=UPI00036263AD
MAGLPESERALAHEAQAVLDEQQEQQHEGFEVSLENFSGPFEVLLNLIGKRELDITEVALAAVTDEFIAYIRRLQEEKGFGPGVLDEVSEFLVVAATLLDLKAARLLPQGEVESDEDIASLEARDLLFARLLQYRAFKQAAIGLGETLAQEGLRLPRQAGLEPAFQALLPELDWRHTPEDFAAIAAIVLRPREPLPTEVGLDHLHAPQVSVRDQAVLIGQRLSAAAGAPLSFRALVADAGGSLVVVARFLALLEMYRDQVIAFEQLSPLGELTIRWTGHDEQWNAENLNDEYGAEPLEPEASP